MLFFGAFNILILLAANNYKFPLIHTAMLLLLLCFLYLLCETTCTYNHIQIVRTGICIPDLDLADAIYSTGFLVLRLEKKYR